jgi:hypothetical protein
MQETNGQAPFVLAQLQCGCTVMQRREENTGLFYLLGKVSSGRAVTLYCPEHRRQQVKRLITRTRKRDHWPLVEKTICQCQHEIIVPPPPAEGDEPTMPHSTHGQHGIYVRCPSCQHWGNYGFIGTAEDRYDVRWVRETCPNCGQETAISYNPFTTVPGETIMFRCIECRQPFSMIFQPKQPE